MNPAQAENQISHNAGADVYRLLSACYYQPDAAFLEEEVFVQLKMAMAQAAPKWVPETAQLEDLFRDAGQEALMLDYSRLFLGPFEILAKPYGSVYLDGEKIVMGDSTMGALALYREGGFELAGDFREMPDHVAVELEFLYLLSLRIGQASDPAERTRLMALKRRFLAEHPGRWIDRFASAVAAGAETGFYRQLAEVTAQFVGDDLQALDETGTRP